MEFREAPRRAFTKNVSTVSISLKQGDFLFLDASACTKPEEEPIMRLSVITLFATPDTVPEPAPESPHPRAPERAGANALRSRLLACGPGISDDSCAGLAKTEPPDAGWRAARPPTLFASAQSLPAAARFRSLDAACPVVPDPVAQGLAAAPASSLTRRMGLRDLRNKPYSKPKRLLLFSPLAEPNVYGPLDPVNKYR